MHPQIREATGNALAKTQDLLKSDAATSSVIGDNHTGSRHGNTLTFHANYAASNNIPLVNNAVNAAQEQDVPFNVVQGQPDDHTVRLMYVPQFDTESEPRIESMATVAPDGHIRIENPKNRIITNKADYVAEDYNGFDVKAAKDRENSWKNSGIRYSVGLVNDANYFNQKFGEHLSNYTPVEETEDVTEPLDARKTDDNSKISAKNKTSELKKKTKKTYNSEGKRVFIDRGGDEIVFDKVNPSKDIFHLFEDEKIKNILANMDTVAELTGEEFKRSNKKGEDLASQVTEYFNTIDNKVEREDLGTIRLRKEGINSSIAHGLGRIKAIAFKAVPDVIEKGKIIAGTTNYKDRKYDNFLIAAPIKIGKDRASSIYNVIVVINDDGRFNDFYLHEANKINDVSPRLEPQPLKAEGEPSSDTPFINGSVTDNEASRQPAKAKKSLTAKEKAQQTARKLSARAYGTQQILKKYGDIMTDEDKAIIDDMFDDAEHKKSVKDSDDAARHEIEQEYLMDLELDGEQNSSQVAQDISKIIDEVINGKAETSVTESTQEATGKPQAKENDEGKETVKQSKKTAKKGKGTQALYEDEGNAPATTLSELLASEEVSDLMEGMEPVYEVSGREFHKNESNGRTLKERIREFFEEVGTVHNHEIGDVKLNNQSVHNMFAHNPRLSLKMRTVVASIPSVIEKGKVASRINNYKGKREEHIVLVAPVNIKNELHYVGVVINNKGNIQEYWNHKVSSRKGNSLETGSNINNDIEFSRKAELPLSTDTVPQSNTKSQDVLKMAAAKNV